MTPEQSTTAKPAEPDLPRVPLTLLYVPGDRPDRIEKALQSGADVIAIDLEDAVAPQHKASARRATTQILSKSSTVGVGVQVRINGAGTPWHSDDMAALIDLPDYVGIRIPKCQTADRLGPVVERTAGRRLHVLIESALGVEHAFNLARVEGVATVGLGEADLSADLNVKDDNGLAWARARIVNAAIAAGLPPPMLSVYRHLRDMDGLASSCLLGRSLGFFGRAAVHPSHLPIIRRIFTPTAEEFSAAKEVLMAVESAQAVGVGALVLPDGRFVDEAVVRQARRVVSLMEH